MEYAGERKNSTQYEDQGFYSWAGEGYGVPHIHITFNMKVAWGGGGGVELMEYLSLASTDDNNSC